MSSHVDLPAAEPQLWGGVECSIVRLQNSWRNQLAETGHIDRLADLDAIAALGISTLRYPLLWEAISPNSPETADFSWHDVRLGRARELGIDIIAGLLHHGSGPHYTSLTRPEFPDLLARHALSVARRYPWLRRFTPVNEPLTTARFSALYGFWYPHERNLHDFARAFVNQCRGVCLSMRAIRTVIPDAQLVQTEDLGKVFSTPVLDSQAVYENERRWLTFDLLLGRVDRNHPWFARFLDYGIAERELMEFVQQPCPPDVLGVNHYLTSERFLEHRRSRWPADLPSDGNGRSRYVDLEAVRVPLPPGSLGAEARLREVCDRYHLSVAATEVHHGCSREEQMRWLVEVWSAARSLAAEGKPVRAVTAWALFGCFDWNSLLTRRNGAYEPGAFDVRGSAPRLTALGRCIRSMARGSKPKHAVLDNVGWWHREERFYRPPALRRVKSAPRQQRSILIAGAHGPLARALRRICAHRGLEHVVCLRSEPLREPAGAARILNRHRPWAVVYVASGWRRRPGVRNDVEALAAACAARDVQLLSFSANPVFDHREPGPFDEHDTPLSPCRRSSSVETERQVLACHPGALVVRTSALYGPWEEEDMVLRWLRALSRNELVRLPAESLCSPTYLPDLVHGALDLLVDGEQGVWHLTNEGHTTWHGFGLQVAQTAGLDPGLVVPHAGLGDAPVALSSRRGRIMPSLASGLHRFFSDCETHWDLRGMAETAG